MTDYKLKVKEVAEILPDEFMISIGANHDTPYMVRKSKIDVEIVQVQYLNQYTSTGWKDAHKVNLHSVASWIINGDLINGMKLENYLSYGLLGDISIDVERLL